MIRRLPPSALALIAVNAVPLAGVFFLDWRVFDILALFWIENLAIGLVNVLRMAAVGIKTAQFGAFIMIPFFCVHYGMFCFVHGSFVVAFFGRDAGVAASDGFDPLSLFLSVISRDGILWSSAGLLLSHLFSFFANFLIRGEYRQADFKKLMADPYGRVIILHLTILAGGGLVAATGESAAALAFLVVLKTGLDLATHLREHKTTAGTVA